MIGNTCIATVGNWCLSDFLNACIVTLIINLYHLPNFLVWLEAFQSSDINIVPNGKLWLAENVNNSKVHKYNMGWRYFQQVAMHITSITDITNLGKKCLDYLTDDRISTPTTNRSNLTTFLLWMEAVQISSINIISQGKLWLYETGATSIVSRNSIDWSYIQKFSMHIKTLGGGVSGLLSRSPYFHTNNNRPT